MTVSQALNMYCQSVQYRHNQDMMCAIQGSKADVWKMSRHHCQANSNRGIPPTRHVELSDGKPSKKIEEGVKLS